MGDYRDEIQDNSSSVAAAGSSRPRVLVTGFGPFGEHTVNASWESVKELKEHSDLNNLVDLVTLEIPVKYSDVSLLVPDLWKQYKPDLVIHCGVSGLLAWKNIIQIESHAHCHGYLRPDVENKTPCEGFCAADDGEKCIATGLNLTGLETWMDSGEECMLTCQLSDDAGRYLCEYIYYTSLRINENATLFIHVPPLYRPFGPKEISVAIKTVILKVLELNKLFFALETKKESKTDLEVQSVHPEVDLLPAFT